jgi:hypothetical protein
MIGIPMMQNERMTEGYFYSGSFGTFRPSGFFPNDVSHFAGYMAGILLICMALVSYKRNLVWWYSVMFFGVASLIFSLSRSGIFAFFLFGLPALLLLLSRFTDAIFRRTLRFGIIFLFMLPPTGMVMSLALSSFSIELPSVFELLSTRVTDLINPGEDETGGSMDEHIITRLASLDAFASSPLIGVGLGVNNSPWYSETYNRYYAGAHSYHFDMLAQTGIIGALLQLYLMLMVLKYMWRGVVASKEPSLERHLLAGLLAAYVAILLGNFLYGYFLLDFVWFIMGIGVALSRLLIVGASRNTCNQSALGYDENLNRKN